MQENTNTNNIRNYRTKQKYKHQETRNKKAKFSEMKTTGAKTKEWLKLTVYLNKPALQRTVQCEKNYCDSFKPLANAHNNIAYFV